MFLKLKSLNFAKKSLTFILTDGLFDDEDASSLFNLISFIEENDMPVYGIGLGFFPEKIKNVFSKAIWSLNPDNLLNALSVFYADETTQSGSHTIVPYDPMFEDIEKVTDNIEKIGLNYNNYFTYKRLIGYLNSRAFYLESTEETSNRDEANNVESNKNNINEEDYMCKKGYFKGLKVLCCCFWSNAYSEDEEKWIRPEYLVKSYSGTKCLNDAFKYYDIDLVIKIKYNKCIEELSKGGKYYAAWIICGNATEKKRNKF